MFVGNYVEILFAVLFEGDFIPNGDVFEATEELRAVVRIENDVAAAGGGRG